MGKPKRAAIYRRVSTDEQEDNYSLPNQSKECRALCEAHGYDVVADEHDVHSGYKLETRRGLNTIRELVRAGVVDVVVVWKLDRLSRRMWHVPKLLEEAEENGVVIKSVTEPHLDTSTIPGKMMVMMLAGWAEQERETFRMRSETGRRNRVESGKPMVGPRPPYGYQWRLGEINRRGVRDKIGLDPNPDTAAIVTRLWMELFNGTSLRGVCALFNAENVPTPNGAPLWEKSTIQRIIRNPVYWGEGYAYRIHWQEVKRTNRLTGEKHTVLAATAHDAKSHVPLSPEVAPPLIDPEIARAVHERLAMNNNAAPRRNLKPENYLLRGGFVRCGHCNRVMSCRLQRNQRTGKERLQYRCTTHTTAPGACFKNTIEANVVHKPVWELVTRILSQPEIVERELQRLTAEEADPTAKRRADVEKRLADYERQRAKLAQAIALLGDEETSAPLLAQLKTLGELVKEGRKELASLEEEHAGWRTARDSMARLADWCGSIAPRVDSLTHHEKQQLLHVLGIKVTVWKPGHVPESVEDRYAIDTLPFAKEPEREPLAVGCTSGDMRARMSPGSTQ